MNEIQKKQKTASERYSDMVLKEYNALSSEPVQFTPNQKRLAQHLFIKTDSALKTLEAKRAGDPSKSTMLPYTWQNINLTKLAVDSIHRIEIGLDALIPNHLSMVPYWNKHLEKYDLDLSIGYVGKDYYRRKMAYDEPSDIIYELVYSTDVFEPIKKSHGIDVESYKFEIKNPFERGRIIGGFGYIVYKDHTKNKLVIVTEVEFKESEALSKGSFWRNNPKAMRYKTIVNRATDKVLIDPDKTNVSFFEVEQSENEDFEQIEESKEEQIIEIDPDQALKNSQARVVDIDLDTVKDVTEERTIQEQADEDQARHYEETEGMEDPNQQTEIKPDW